MSHPTWMRGLKRLIEQCPSFPHKSHPTWMRGLKHKKTIFYQKYDTSHPTWMRGLKRLGGTLTNWNAVASHVDAWIET